MKRGLASRVVQGRVLPAGIAQAVSRRNGAVRIWLTVMPGHPAAASRSGRVVTIPFAEPVEVQAGESAAVVIEWLPGGTRDDAGPVWMPCATTLTCAHIRR
jgi:hypothetical protein